MGFTASKAIRSWCSHETTCVLHETKEGLKIKPVRGTTQATQGSAAPAISQHMTLLLSGASGCSKYTSLQFLSSVSSLDISMTSFCS